MNKLSDVQWRTLEELYWLALNHGACDMRGPRGETGWATKGVVEKLVGKELGDTLRRLVEKGLCDAYNPRTGKFNLFAPGSPYGYAITHGGMCRIASHGYGEQR